MKLIALILFFLISVSSAANNPYRAYLLSKILGNSSASKKELVKPNLARINFEVPRFERPRGAVFCRMEDYLTTKTKVWIKIGVK